MNGRKSKLQSTTWASCGKEGGGVKSPTLAFGKCCYHIWKLPKRMPMLQGNWRVLLLQPNIRSYATSSNSGKTLGRRTTSALRPRHKKAIENWRGWQDWRRGDSCVEKTCYKSRKQGSLQKKKRLSKKEKGVKSRNEVLQWFHEYKDEEKNEAHQIIQNIRNNRSFGKRKTYLFRNII